LLCILQKTNGEVKLGFNGDLYPTAGASVVMTTSGDMVKYQSGARARLGIGSANQILQVKSSLPSWETVDLADTVLTTAGDVLIENATPELARLGAGTQYNNLQMGASLPAWASSSTSIMTGAMDILYSSSANTLARLGASTDGDVLTTHSTGSAPTWETPSAGSGNTFARVVKKANESVTNTATLQDDDELLVALTASKTYGWQLWLYATAGAGGLRTGWSLPTGATGEKSNATYSSVTIDDMINMTTARTHATDGTVEFLPYIGRVIMSTTAGNMQFQFAQDSGSATASTVLEGSVLVVWEETS